MSHLKLVSNAPAQPRPRKQRTPGLSEKEAHRVAIALRNFVRGMGSRSCAAVALDSHPAYITKLLLREKRAGVGFAAKLARYLGTPLETLLEGRLIEAGSCPTCAAMRRLRTTA
jgi:hypothetical protein